MKGSIAVTYEEILYRLQGLTNEDDLDDDLTNEIVDIYEDGDFKQFQEFIQKNNITVNVEKAIPKIYIALDIISILLVLHVAGVGFAIIIAIYCAFQNNFLIEKEYVVEVQKKCDNK